MIEPQDLTARPSAALAGSAGNDKHCSDTAMLADSKRSQPSSAATIDSKADVAVAPQAPALGSTEENPSTPPAASPAQACRLHMRSNEGKPQQQTPARSAQHCHPISDADRSSYQALQAAVASFTEAELELLGVTKQEMLERTAAMLHHCSQVNAHAMKPSSSPVGHASMSAQRPTHPSTNSNSYCQAAGPALLAAGMTRGQLGTAAGTAPPPGQPQVDAPPHTSPAVQDKGQTSSQQQDGLPGWTADELEALEALQALSGPNQHLAPLSYQAAQQEAEASRVSPQLAAMAALFLEVWEGAAPPSGNGKPSKLDPCQINNSSGLAASPDIAAAAQAYEALVAAASQAPAGRYSRTRGRSSTPGSAHQAALQGSFACNNNSMHSYHAAQLASTPPGWTECYTGHATYSADMDGDSFEANASSVPFGQFSPAQHYSSTGFISKQPGGMRAVGGRKPVAGRSTAAHAGRGGRGAARRKQSTSPSPATCGVNTADADADADADGHQSCFKSVFPSTERVSATLHNRLSLTAAVKHSCQGSCCNPGFYVLAHHGHGNYQTYNLQWLAMLTLAPAAVDTVTAAHPAAADTAVQKPTGFWRSRCTVVMECRPCSKKQRPQMLMHFTDFW